MARKTLESEEKIQIIVSQYELVLQQLNAQVQNLLAQNQ